jgi:phospholipid/cholesterol/gamma-HCH transport system substrate-binding protein
MLRFRPEARVGLLIFTGMLALIGAYWFLKGSIVGGRTYTVYATFRDVQRMDKGASVRMAGVPIGEVLGISLTKGNMARLELRIRDGIRIPKGSHVLITSGGLVGDVFVQVEPGHGPGYLAEYATIRGQDSVTLDSLMPQASKLLSQLQTTVESLNSVLGDKRMLAAMKNSMINTEAATEQAVGLVKDFRNMAVSNSDELNKALANATKASADFAAFAANVRGIMEKGGSKDMTAMLESGKTAADNLVKASEKVKELASDQQITSDLKATLSNLRKTSENAEVLTEKLSHVLGGKPGQRPTIHTESPTLDLFRDFHDGRFRVDYNVTIPSGKTSFYRLGLLGIGDSTRFNLQAGRILNPGSRLRYGMYSSRLGVGFDKDITNRTGLSADLYGLNDTKLELKGRYDLTDDWGVWLGTDDLLDTRGLLLGVQYRK